MQQRVTRVDVASTAKVAGILFILLGIFGTASYMIYVLVSTDGPGTIEGATLGLALIAPVLAGGVLGIWGIVFGALAAWLFNTTAKLTGGIAIELTDA